MLCVDCDFETEGGWSVMRNHYSIIHPEVKRPDKYYTKEARIICPYHHGDKSYLDCVCNRPIPPKE